MGAIASAKEIIEDLLGLDLGIGRVTTKLDSLSTRIDACDAERAHHMIAPAVRHDVEQGVRNAIGQMFAGLLFSPAAVVAEAAGSLVELPGEPVTRTAPGLTELDRLTPVQLQLFFRYEQSVARIVALAPVDGLTFEERKRRIAEIDQEKLSLLAQHADVVDRASRSGVQLQHRPETVNRRLAEQHDREREDFRRAEAARDARLRGKS